MPALYIGYARGILGALRVNVLPAWKT